MLTLWSLQPRKYEMNTHVIIHLIITLEKKYYYTLDYRWRKYRMLYNIAYVFTCENGNSTRTSRKDCYKIKMVL